MDKTNEKLKIFLPGTLEEKDKKKKEMVEFPLFKECYKEALNAVFENAYNYESEKSRQRKEELEIDAYDNVNNIISFLGGRGSGKTTAVTEFCSILKEFEGEKREYWFANLPISNAVEKYKEEDCSFIILKPIDSSVLEEKENIVELVWANMYEIFYHEVDGRRNADEELKRKLIKEFDEVYQNYSGVNNRKREENIQETALFKLKNMPSSLKTRKSFERLLQDFFLFLEKRRDKKQFLVVAIDDLDLNIKYGFEMLEQIHKYLSHPQIIVLLAMDFEQISMICEKHFITGMRTLNADWDKRVIRHADKLSEDYLEKVLPPCNRFYLPGNDVMSKKVMIQAGEETVSVKEFILYKLAQKLSIHYDGHGIKKHFSLPNTVREFVNYNNFLNALYTIQWDTLENAGIGEEEKKALQSEYMHKYDHNYEWFNRDIIERMTYQKLNNVQREQFKLIIDRDIERRARYAVSFLNGWCGEGTIIDNVDEKDYTYSELLECINVYGRKRYEDKALIHCLLASFTLQMTREYYSFRYHTESKQKEKAMKNLEKFIGDSFGGKWLGEMLPAVVFGSNSNVGVAGYIKNPPIAQIELTFPLQSSGTLKVNTVKEVINDNHLASKLAVLLTFLNNCGADMESASPVKPVFGVEENTVYDAENKNLKKKKKEMKIRFSGQSSGWDIFSFMGSPDNNERFCEEIEKWITDSIIEGVNAFNIDKMSNVFGSDERKKIKETVHQQIAAEGGQAGMAFPFYDLDMSYNVLKRARIKCREQLGSTVQEKDLYERIQYIFGFIAEELLYEDIFYSTSREIDYRIAGKSELPGRTTSFAYNFVSGWLIKLFGVRFYNPLIKEANKAIEGKEILDNSFNEMLCKVLSGIQLAQPANDAT